MGYLWIYAFIGVHAMNVYNITDQYNKTEQYLAISIENAIKSFQSKYKDTEIISVALVYKDIKFTEAEICTQ